MSRPTFDQASKQNIGDSEFVNLVVSMTWARYTSVINLQICFTLFSLLGSKVTIYVLGPKGYESMDITEEVEKIDEEKQRKKYDDIDYLADRSNMKR